MAGGAQRRLLDITTLNTILLTGVYIRSIKKDYGNSSKVTVYNSGVRIDPPKCQLHFQIACQICWTRKVNPIPSPSSLMRSKTAIADITLANEFDLFCTFTFDPRKVDSLDVEKTKKVMSKWLNNSKTHSPDLKYLIVAEKHKSGRIHFHALFKNYNGSLTDSKKQKNGRKLWNIDNYRWGFSTAVKIDNIAKVSNYVQKYITKDMLKLGNKKRYWCSRNLKRPTKIYNVDIQEEVFSRPLFIEGEYKSEYYKIYSIRNVEHRPELDSKKVRAQQIQQRKQARQSDDLNVFSDHNIYNRRP